MWGGRREIGERDRDQRVREVQRDGDMLEGDIARDMYGCGRGRGTEVGIGTTERGRMHKVMMEQVHPERTLICLSVNNFIPVKYFLLIRI